MNRLMYEFTKTNEEYPEDQDFFIDDDGWEDWDKYYQEVEEDLDFETNEEADWYEELNRGYAQDRI